MQCLCEVQRQKVGMPEEITYKKSGCVTDGQGKKRKQVQQGGRLGWGSGSWLGGRRSRDQEAGGSAGWGDGMGSDNSRDVHSSGGSGKAKGDEGPERGPHLDRSGMSDGFF